MRRTLIAVVGLLVILGMTNFTIAQREAVVVEGIPVLLELRPVDPRSIMQGDYMVLRYNEAVFPPSGERDELPARGVFVVRRDDNHVATFSRLYDEGELADDEVLLKYKQVDKNGRIRLGAGSFFFQEGQAQHFDIAEYGVLHVDVEGNSVLVGLADENYKLIVPPEEP